MNFETLRRVARDLADEDSPEGRLVLSKRQVLQLLEEAGQPAEDDTPAICDPRYFEDDEQTAEEARGVALVAALEMARDAMKGNGLTERELPRVFEIIEAALLAAADAAEGEEVHVHIEGHDVYTATLQPSGMASPRFVVRVKAAAGEEAPTFEQAWSEKEKQGFRYGADALAQQPGAQAVGLTDDEILDEFARKGLSIYDDSGATRPVGLACLDAARALLSRAAPSGEPVVLRNPYTGELRDIRDVESDPAGTLIVKPGEPLKAAQSASVMAGTKLWLWKNGDHYIAYQHLYPCYSPGGDPMTLGEPCGWAEFRESHDCVAPQPSGEPVAWRWSENGGKSWFAWTTDWSHYERAKELGCLIEYAAPQPAAQQAEPESPMKAAADALRRKTELEQAHQDGYRDGFKAAQAMLAKAEQPAEEALGPFNTADEAIAALRVEEARGVDGGLMEAIRRYAFLFALHTQNNTDASRAEADAALARVRALLAAPAAAETQVIPRTEHEYRVPILGEKQAAQSREAQGGALSDDDVLLNIGIAAWEKHSRQPWSPDGLLMACVAVRDAVLSRAASEPRAEGLTDAARDVLAERQRQISVEGWTPEHDDQHDGNELAMAAACYANPVLVAVTGLRAWPWAPEWWKPKDPRSNLVRAGALILAEIERLDRAAHHQTGGGNAD